MPAIPGVMYERRASGMSVSTIAAKMAPVIEPWPPRITMATISMDRMNRKDSGLISDLWCDTSPPARPANAAPMTNAATL